MANTNKELDNPIYTGLTQATQQQEQPLYDLIQHETRQYEMVEFPKERSLVPESKEVVSSSNVQHHTNGVGNYSNHKERVKWLIVVILLITSTLLNVIVLITLFTKETSSPQVINTTQIAQDIAQAGYVSYHNTTDEMIFNLLTTLIDLVGDTKQLVNNNITTLIDLVGDTKQLVNNNITTLIDLVGETKQLVNNNITTLIDLVGDTKQLVNNNITTLIDLVGDTKQLVNNNITTLIDLVGDTKQLVNNNITTLIDLVIDTKQLVNNNITTLIDLVGQLLADGTMNNVTAFALQQLTSTQSIIEGISNENKGTNDKILDKVDDVLENQNASPISSCQDIKNKHPTSPSGYYHINSQLVYCEMGELCNIEGGWTRLAYLDMTDSTVDCPPGFKLYEVNGVRACGRPDTEGSCVSIKFPSNGISYSEVCGRVVGYQFDSPDALYPARNNINSYYADGVSITKGYPRKHVWTLINGIRSSTSSSSNNCPCNTPPGYAGNINLFIKDDYFCESGNPNESHLKIFYNDPLWDGKQCGSQEQVCCSADGLPWFHKTLSSTTDYLELRVCGDESNANEDTPIKLYELYVK